MTSLNEKRKKKCLQALQIQPERWSSSVAQFQEKTIDICFVLVLIGEVKNKDICFDLVLNLKTDIKLELFLLV